MRRLAVVAVLAWVVMTRAAVAGEADGWAAPELRVVRHGERYGVEVCSGGRAVLSSPEEGLWSIGTDWRDGWPAEWRHAEAAEVETAGPWTILRGKLDVPGGTWQLRDAYRPRGRAIECVRRFTWDGEEDARRCTLSARWTAKAAKARVVLPGIIYHGNPSGAASGRVPVFSGEVGEEAIFEEHRYPVPFASIEWSDAAGLRGAALGSVPSPTPYANLPDQWWSLGVAAREGATELALLSGPCASNGRRSVVKAVQSGFVAYDSAFLNVPPGAVIEKTFFLEAYPVEREGSGFRRPLRAAIDRLEPFGVDGLPSFSEILRAKYRFSKSRWHEAEGADGFKKYPDRSFFVMGWCGQAAAPGYALQVLAEGLDDPGAGAMVQKSLDTLSDARFYEGGFHTWYDYDKKTWSRHEPLSQGQAMLSFARAIRLGRSGGLETGRWEAFLEKACDFHAERILGDGWRPRSTDEAFFIAPLCEASVLFENETYRRAAVKAAEHYAARHVSMREPYWGGTLDARCEDKEGAYAALQGFLAVYELTGEARFLAWAEHACDVVLTYLVLWDIDLPPGRLRNHGFKTRGWTVVSPQNQHIDAYGVVIAPDVYRLGQILKRDDLRRLAILMYRSCGQLIDPYGSQGEQPQHTNYAQRGEVDDVFALRGGYAETWTVFWITAHFLNAGARFAELGVPVWE
ncbi:MAG: hypothetical protein HQ582_22645 [Planctomycetes bacterium]|nr:hypothetical protein [Planctomycetota bacterium]